MTELTVGTAGHIDHGKTALVRALTGVDCDRLPEERARGMTIELGFAPLRLPSGREVSVVDVPGHERFLRTMAVGARSIDLALLCVAADDGVMPQTREHAAVLRLLRVRSALVAVTKQDTAPEGAEAVGRSAFELLRQAGVAATRVVVTSSVTGMGLPDLAAAIDAELAAIAAPQDRGIPRLHVDRGFSRTGVGTVVTGVLMDGRLTVGQQVEVFPSGARGRILELQRRGRAVEAVEPGGRLAASLRGVPAESAPRGSVLGRPGDASGTALVDCLLEAPEVGASGLRQGVQVEVLCGTATSRGRVWLAGEERLTTGSRGFAQLSLEAPIWAIPGDRIILRGQGPLSVLAGGVVLDAHPRRHRRWVDAPLDQWTARERALRRQPDLGTLAVLEAGWAPAGLSAAEVGRRVGCSPDLISAALQAAEEGGRLARLGSVHIDSGRLAELRSQAVARVVSYQRLHPLEPGMPRRQLLAELGLQRPAVGDSLLSELAAEGLLEQRGGTVAEAGSLPPGRTPQVERVSQLLRSAGRLPPGPGELRAAGLTRPVEGYLVQSGEAARLPGGGLISASALEQMESEIEAELRRSPAGLTVAQLRDRVGTSRRILLPVLERMEAGGEFSRSGDLHLWRPERSRELQCG